MTKEISEVLIENWGMHYDRDESIRAEFTSKRIYIAFMKANAQGHVHIHSGSTVSKTALVGGGAA